MFLVKCLWGHLIRGFPGIVLILHKQQSPQGLPNLFAYFGLPCFSVIDAREKPWIDLGEGTEIVDLLDQSKVQVLMTS